MDTLFSTNSSRIMRITNTTNKLFYSKYRFAVKAKVKYAFLMRGLNLKQLQFRATQFGSYANYTLPPTQIELVEKMMKALIPHSSTMQFNSHYDYFICYTNDLSIVDIIHKVNQFIDIEINECLVLIDSDSILRKNNRYQYRTYFKKHQFEINDAVRFSQHIQELGDTVKPSPSMVNWMHRVEHRHIARNFSRSSKFFVDHNDGGEVFMMQLAYGVTPEKTVKIINTL